MASLLALSGSLRAGSLTTEVLRAAARLAPGRVTLYEGLAGLPAFNPDLDLDPPPPAVAHLREALRAAGGLLICCPEYAHGVPGAFKNALDWVVGSGELVDKPVGLVNASPRSTFVQAQLTEILTVMNAKLLPEASPALPQLRRDATAEELAAREDVAGPLRAALAALGIPVPGPGESQPGAPPAR